MTPTVTVLVPVYNRERLVEDAITSVLEQDFPDFELLLVDDGSTDDTPAVLDSWAKRDARIVVVHAERNLGIPGALNLGLAHARGRYVARLDSDDRMLPRRLAEQAAILDARPDVVLVSCAYELVDAAGKPLGVWRGDEPHEVVRFLLSFFNIVGGGGQVMFRLGEVRAEGGYDTRYPSSEDYDLWVRLLRRGRIHTLPFIGMTKRVHGDQSHDQFASIKRHNWNAIMRKSLEPYLGRTVSDDEIAAVITVWRHDGQRGHGATADRVMREAFRRFRTEHDRGLQRSAADRIAQQWREAADVFRGRGHRIEAAKYALRALRWKSFT